MPVHNGAIREKVSGCGGFLQLLAGQAMSAGQPSQHTILYKMVNESRFGFYPPYNSIPSPHGKPYTVPYAIRWRIMPHSPYFP